MPTYRQWNDAIANYFSAGLPAGAPFYLSVDEHVLVEIGQMYFDSDLGTDYVADFLKAVQEICVRGSGDGVSLVPVSDRSTTRPPNCVAFLGATVLAAHRMDSDRAAAENNYFTRLREVLGLPTDEFGRPTGLAPPAPEEGLWNNLNDWIRANGWVPSAERGIDAPSRFINYPMSQSLLRQGDKGRLADKLRLELNNNMDWEQIGVWFLQSAFDFPTNYLRNLAIEARNAAGERFEAIINAVYEVYSQIDWSQSSYSSYDFGTTRNPRRLTAGLYRVSDVIWGTVDYYLYPRMPQRLNTQDLRVKNGTEIEQLQEVRNGRFRALPWSVDPAGGRTYEVQGDSEISELALPSRDFWVLIRDPFDETSGIFASWGKPNLGEPFLLLCQRKYSQHLEMLRSGNLIEWEEIEALYDPYEGWLEYRGCRVLSPNWEHVSFGGENSLLNELIPRVRASISLRGGLKIVGQRDTWMVDHLPVLVINSDSAQVVSINDDIQPTDPLMKELVDASSPIRLPTLEPGDYTIDVLVSGMRADRRHLRVLAWESLDAVEPPQSFGTKVGDYTLRGGALVKEDEIL